MRERLGESDDSSEEEDDGGDGSTKPRQAAASSEGEDDERSLSPAAAAPAPKGRKGQQQQRQQSAEAAGAAGGYGKGRLLCKSVGGLRAGEPLLNYVICEDTCSCTVEVRRHTPLAQVVGCTARFLPPALKPNLKLPRASLMLMFFAEQKFPALCGSLRRSSSPWRRLASLCWKWLSRWRPSHWCHMCQAFRR